MRLIIYEDETFDDLYPLTYLRAIFELRCGATTLAEKIQRIAPDAQVACFARNTLAPLLRRRLRIPVNDPAALQGDDLLLVNGRWLALDKAVQLEGDEEVGIVPKRVVSREKDTGKPDLVVPPTVLYARVTARTATPCAGGGVPAVLQAARDKLPARSVKATLISFPWDLVHHNPRAISADFAAWGRRGILGSLPTMSCVYGSNEQVYVDPTAEIQPMVCIDTKGGPVYIDRGVVVNPHTRIEGPCYIGPNTTIVGARIREGCSIGPVCRVGGEVEESIIHGYSNKYHDGFLGHAYVCEWVNLGALTTNSDLKNDYSEVEVHLKGHLKGQPRNTGDTKVGCFIGDHTKTSIGTILNTGTVVGIMCNVMASGGVTPKFIPSGTVFMNNRFLNIAFDNTIETAREAMRRRKNHLTGKPKVLSRADLRAIEAAMRTTKPERDELVRRSRKQLGRELGLKG